MQVTKRVDGWKTKRGGEFQPDEQLNFVAHIVEYITELTKMPTIPRSVPIVGPHFEPPTFTEDRLRGKLLSGPDGWYLRPVTILHPFFDPKLRACPRDQSHVPEWDGWTTSGPREVHGLFHEEMAYGYQMRCKQCPMRTEGGTKQQRCYATTSAEYWRERGIEHWQLPRESSASRVTTAWL